MNARRPRGFTLLELMVSISILTVIMSIVYVSFNSVITASEVAREVAEDMRMRQFLTRRFSNTIPMAYADLAVQLPSYEFVGEEQQGPYGPADSLSFVVASELLGGRSLPGLYKRVHFEVVDQYAVADGDALTGVSTLDGADGEEARVMLEYREEPLVVDALSGDDFGLFGEFSFEEGDYASWRVPVRSVDFTFFDGEEWVESWESMETGLLPWAVRVRVNFHKSEARLTADYEAGIDPVEDPDFEITLLVPVGAGSQYPFLPMNPAEANLGEQNLFQDR